MTDIYDPFPYTELRKPDGQYYDNPTEMLRAGFVPSQMWSVIEAEGHDGSEWVITGPVHHYINLLGYCATAEHHDENTYYHECIKTAQEAAEEAAYYCETCED